MKPRETPGLLTVAVLAVIGLAAAFFLIGSFSAPEDQSKKVHPAPAANLSESIEQAALSGSGNQGRQPTTLTASAQQAQPKVVSDEEGTRLNLKAYELIQQKKYQEAEPLLRQAIESFPSGTTSPAYKYALYNLGHVLRRSGKPKEAIPFLEACIRLDPSWAKAQTELSIAKADAERITPTRISQNIQ